MKICSPQKKILIIKFGGLGDVVLSLNAIYSIFNHHNKCKLVLLTEEPYKKLLLNSNWFEIIDYIKLSSKIFLTMAMAAIGLSTNLKDIKNMGYKPFIVGFIAMLTVGIVCIITIESYLKLST